MNTTEFGDIIGNMDLISAIRFKDDRGGSFSIRNSFDDYYIIVFDGMTGFNVRFDTIGVRNEMSDLVDLFFEDARCATIDVRHLEVVA